LDSFECYQYHQTKISTALGVSSIKEKIPSLDLTHFKNPDIFAVVFFHSLHILISKMETHFVIADGLNKFTNQSFQNRVIKYLRQVADCDMPVIATMNTKPDLSHLTDIH